MLQMHCSFVRGAVLEREGKNRERDEITNSKIRPINFQLEDATTNLSNQTESYKPPLHDEFVAALVAQSEAHFGMFCAATKTVAKGIIPATRRRIATIADGGQK